MNGRLHDRLGAKLWDSIRRTIGFGYSKPYPLLALAEHYRLRDHLERKRSVTDLEWLFFRLAHKFDPAFFIEIGAKNARSSVRARRHVPRARIAAFEANPLNFARFKDKGKLAVNDIEYHNIALSSQDGEVSFNLVNSGGSPLNGRGSLLSRASGWSAHSTVTVPCRRFDSLFTLRAEDNACLWIDVEGANRDVLVGGGASLGAAALIFIEVETRMIWKGQWLYSDVASHLADFGLAPLARDYQSRHQHNVVFIRESLLPEIFVRELMGRYRGKVTGLVKIS